MANTALVQCCMVKNDDKLTSDVVIEMTKTMTTLDLSLSLTFTVQHYASVVLTIVVCASVHLSHVGIVLKWLNIRS